MWVCIRVLVRIRALVRVRVLIRVLVLVRIQLRVQVQTRDDQLQIQLQIRSLYNPLPLLERFLLLQKRIQVIEAQVIKLEIVDEIADEGGDVDQ